MEPIDDESNTSLQTRAVEEVPLVESVVEPNPDIPEDSTSYEPQAIEENFFDRHITAITFFTSWIPYFIIINIVLGAFNFRKKRDDFFKGVGFLFLAIMIVAVVGFGLCVLALSGLIK